ncbi:hypothetical protein CesoFtcFv8_007297 [Champsocephalus esox]|uniref:Uncharacterized protein n=1 Tax=Champsocephalus esox TaxID=159716 RepID=A0AAN8CE02_9TELE|nr:hypothetical protein CesoFtcFv8_007297 [Champsocephalus esox]
MGTNPESAQYSDPSAVTPQHTPNSPCIPSSSLAPSQIWSSDRRTYGSRDKARDRDHVQSLPLDPRAGTTASGYGCTLKGHIPETPPSSSSKLLPLILH